MMLKELASSILPSNFIILADYIEAKGYDLFFAFLNKHLETNSGKVTKLICTENQPIFYLKYLKNCDRIECHDFFSDPCGWNSESSTVISLESFTSNLNDSEITYFIDSLHPLVLYNGFSSVYKDLFKLKKIASKFVCLVHTDLLSETDIEDLKFLSTSFITIQALKTNHEVDFCNEKIVNITYKKLGGKIIKETEIIFVNKNNFEIVSKEKSIKQKVCKQDVPNIVDDIENLTTFKLNLQMSDNEKKAKSQLVLPYLRRAEKCNDTSEILYDIEPNDLEDDPDDDLDI